MATFKTCLKIGFDKILELIFARKEHKIALYTDDIILYLTNISHPHQP